MSESNLDEESGGIDLGDLGGEEEAGDISLDDDLASALDEGGGEGEGGEGTSLDSDLESMLGDESGEGGDAEGGEGDEGGEAEGGEGGQGITLDSDLESMLGDAGGESGEAGGDEGGEEITLDSDLESMLGDSEIGDAGGEGGAPAAVPAKAGGEDAIEVSRSLLSSTEAVNLDFLLDVKLDVTFEVGRSKMVISDLLTLGQGSVVELHRLVGEELDFMVNGKLMAKGEVVVVNEKFGCRITEIISPEQRVKHLANL
ncbi:MAG: flagellar motor switch protein FliN [SAR324 cluster bacterium]|nr:flagellar motor switch protein FliN [SAR324 cluster bacterium]